jgi:hypothetical protein
MNKKYIKIGAITLVSLGAIYGGYKLFKYLTKPTEEQAPLPVDIVNTATEEEVKTVSKPTFDGNKLISINSRGQEAKSIQQALNSLVEDAKRTSSKDPVKEARRKDVASLPRLTLDGIFGKKSIASLIKIMGKSSASYNEVRDKRLAFNKAYGMGNPYEQLVK